MPLPGLWPNWPLPPKLPPRDPEDEPRLYCCKKWVAGTLNKFYSRQPCPAGSVQCSDPNPPEPDGDCESKCRERFGERGREAGGRRSPRDEIAYQRCMDRCRDEPPKPPEECDPGYVWSDIEQKCVPQKKECTPPFVWSDALGKCVPPKKKCDPPLVWDPVKKMCVKKVPGEDPCLYGVGHKMAPGLEDVPCDSGYHPIEDPDDGSRWCCPDKKIPGEGPCSGEGYEREFGASQCNEGFSPKKDPDTGNWWCCKDDDKECEEGHWDEELGRCVPDTPGECSEGEHWSEFEERCVPDGDGDGDGGGEFQWGEGLQGLLGRIMERANYLLDYPRGLTPQERQGVINYAIESVKSGERGAIRSKQEQLARAGLLGSGFEFDEIGKIQRETRGRETQVRRELAIDELDRRFQELMGTTGMAQSLTGTLMQGEQIPEVLSGARRSEGQASMNALMALLGGSMGGQNNQYWNAILTQLMGNQGGQQGGGIWDWLPWLLAGTGSRTRV